MVVLGSHALAWPETKALLDRLGVEIPPRCSSITIAIPVRQPVTVTFATFAPGLATLEDVAVVVPHSNCANIGRRE